MILKYTITLLISWSLCLQLSAQGPELKFGVVYSNELSKSESEIAPGAHAEILGDYGNVNAEGKYIRFTRTKIYHQDGYQYADVVLPQYNDSKITRVRGFTHNLVNGKVESTPLETDQIIKEQVVDQLKQVKITFPKVKAGSVIDLEVTRKFKPGFAMDEWVFQRNIPVVWSELNMTSLMIKQMQYVSQGLEPYTISEHADVTKVQTSRYDAKKQHKWARANLKPIKSEPYISSINNYIAKIVFQYIGSASYSRYGDLLMESKFFNESINKSKFIKSELPEFSTASTDLEKAQRIFSFIRDNMKWTGYYGKLPDQLREAWRKKQGDVPTINYLLTSALRQIGLKADPVFISTRKNGLPHPEYAIHNKFNYLICRVKVDGEWVLLDASGKGHPFGVLPYRCLNGRGWWFNDFDSDWISLTPKGFISTSTQARITFTASGTATGSIKSRYSSYARYGKQQELAKQGEAQYLKNKNLPGWELTNINTENEDDITSPLVITYDIASNENEDSDLIYMNPVISSSFKKNPFEAEERTMPISFAYRTLDRYASSITIPENYTVDELPESKVYQMPDKDIFFQFSASVRDNKISIISTFRINGLYYPAEEYNAIREYFKAVANKHSEQIVLRRVE